MELELSIDGRTQESLCAGAALVAAAARPLWDKSKFNFKVYNEGISNQLVGIWPHDLTKEEQVLVRVYGKSTELFIDRGAEKRNIQRLHSKGCGPSLLCSFKNGICYSYTVGVPLTTDTVMQEDIRLATLTCMADLHSIEWDETLGAPVLFKKIQLFMDLLPELHTEVCFKSAVLEGYTKENIKNEVAEVERAVRGLNCPVTFCHNDTLLANVIWNKEERRVHFIDFEYAAPNFQPFDIANHFCEYAGVDEVDYSRYPSEEYQTLWISQYLSRLKKPSQRPLAWWLAAVKALALASHLFWGTWALVQAHHSSIQFDFAGYSVCRLNEYRRRKVAFLDSARLFGPQDSLQQAQEEQQEIKQTDSPFSTVVPMLGSPQPTS
ncbi:hypothetical protein HAZT_HAZT005039 [Hyalella azteca]|uniref:ethanolamine kinase n=1 Tax=Hyalella azteca TaxID=294128 RepID=A0A6A0GZQ6_HYAAZ|nr:probable ethanolamine kinase [Hyalella azteca]KAA0194357.1 hypothetical protein HAZT_HAZT005039 [Hyalella azteca]